MARSAKYDPIEKFRFRVTVVSLDLSVGSAVTTIAGLSSGGTLAREKFAIISRAGFSKIAPMPQATVKAMTYRENIDNLRSSKIAGLVTYNDVSFSRGVVEGDRNLYDWYRLVNEEIALLTVAQEFSQDQNFIPTQSHNYRKDVIIEVLNREGKPIKAWYLFNAWPISYTPGDSLDASENEKLVEELTLTYESFLELKGGVNGLAEEIARGLAIIASGSILDSLGL